MIGRKSVITNVPVSVFKFGAVEIDIEVSVFACLEYEQIVVSTRLGGNEIKIEAYDESSDQLICKTLTVDGSVSNVSSSGSGSYGAYSGIAFRKGILSFTIVEATAVIVEDRLVLIDGRFG